MSEVKKEYINADDKYVAYREVYVDGSESTEDDKVYTDVELTEVITADALKDAFFKRCVVAAVDNGEIVSYAIPSKLVFDAIEAAIIVEATEYVSAENEIEE